MGWKLKATKFSTRFFEVQTPANIGLHYHAIHGHGHYNGKR